MFILRFESLQNSGLSALKRNIFLSIALTFLSKGGCSSAGRAGRLVIKRSLVQIPAPGKAELHVEVSLSEILNPTLLISEGPAMSW